MKGFKVGDKVTFADIEINHNKICSPLINKPFTIKEFYKDSFGEEYLRLEEILSNQLDRTEYPNRAFYLKRFKLISLKTVLPLP